MKFRAGLVLVGLFEVVSRGASAEPVPLVRVFVAGSPDAVSGMRDALQDQCAHPNLAVMVEDAASADAELLNTEHSSGLADAYVDLRPDNETRVVVVDGQTHEQLEARTLERAPSLDLSIETVVQVVCAAVDSTLSARAAALPSTRSPLPPPPPAPSLVPNAAPSDRVPHRASRALAGWLGVVGVGSDYGAGLGVGGGVVVGASIGSKRLRFGGSLLVDGFPSRSWDRQGAEASIDLYGMRLLPTVEWEASPQLCLLAGLGAGADWLHVSGGNPPAGALAREGTSGVEPLLASLIGARFALALHASAWLALGADVDLARHRYINEASGAPTLFFESPRARLVSLAGLALSFGREPVRVEGGESMLSAGSR